MGMMIKDNDELTYIVFHYGDHVNGNVLISITQLLVAHLVGMFAMIWQESIFITIVNVCIS
jgi:hypothetical protein